MYGMYYEKFIFKSKQNTSFIQFALKKIRQTELLFSKWVNEKSRAWE